MRSGPIVSDEKVERALHWLSQNAALLGEAKRQAVLTEGMVKHVKALEMKKHSELPVSAQEREAMASDRYQQALYAEALAAGELEKLRSLREAAAATVEFWRSEQASLRSMRL